MIEEIKKGLSQIEGTWSEKDGVYSFSALIAERKSLLNRKKLTYSMKFRIDDGSKEVKFTEMLKESGFGLTSGGGGFNDNMSPGFGFKTESYKTGFGEPREGNIEEQSNLFGSKFDYKFDWKTMRKAVEDAAAKNGYQFKYQITSIGL